MNLGILVVIAAKPVPGKNIREVALAAPIACVHETLDDEGLLEALAHFPRVDGPPPVPVVAGRFSRLRPGYLSRWAVLEKLLRLTHSEQGYD
jgi:hypothetical protein